MINLSAFFIFIKLNFSVMKIDPKVDAYIDNAADFAKPILEYLRALIHENCPEVEEAIKWSFPHFLYQGKILCAMSAFKAHAAYGFWLENEMTTMQPLIKERQKNSMFQLGKLKSIDDLPPKPILIAAIKEAMDLTEMGITIKRNAPNKSEVIVPDDFQKRLDDNQSAKQCFEAFSLSNQREYVNWINEAKTETTRNKRIDTSLEWLSEGKDRNWKYKNC